MPALFDPIQLGAILCPNRIVMAPLTRGRASREHVPSEVMSTYYVQRASAGLILTEATGISRLVEEFGLTHQAIAETLGRSRTAVTNLLRLLELAPPVRELLAEGRIDMGHARALLTLPVDQQIDLAREAAAKGLTVREVEQRVSTGAKTAQPRRAKTDRDVARLEEEWSDKLGTAVEIKPRGKRGGKLVLAYRTLDELDLMLQRLGGA